jgi:hypothetical protein
MVTPQWSYYPRLATVITSSATSAADREDSESVAGLGRKSYRILLKIILQLTIQLGMPSA